VLTFAAGEQTKTITINVIGDTVVEGNETLTLTLNNAIGATLVDAQATGTIVDNDSSGDGGGGKKKNNNGKGGGQKSAVLSSNQVRSLAASYANSPASSGFDFTAIGSSSADVSPIDHLLEKGEFEFEL